MTIGPWLNGDGIPRRILRLMCEILGTFPTYFNGESERNTAREEDEVNSPIWFNNIDRDFLSQLGALHVFISKQCWLNGEMKLRHINLRLLHRLLSFVNPREDDLRSFWKEENVGPTIKDWLNSKAGWMDYFPTEGSELNNLNGLVIGAKRRRSCWGGGLKSISKWKAIKQKRRSRHFEKGECSRKRRNDEDANKLSDKEAGERRLSSSGITHHFNHSPFIINSSVMPSYFASFLA